MREEITKEIVSIKEGENKILMMVQDNLSLVTEVEDREETIEEIIEAVLLEDTTLIMRIDRTNTMITEVLEEDLTDKMLLEEASEETEAATEKECQE